jgi:mannitol/fructose-specific phosphotransferase system IIA component (Ntr-type)
MGMLVDLGALLNKPTLIFGLVYTIGALLSKFIGCGLPSLCLNFNWQGAKRIGFGMIPRGEVALIIAGIGLSYGFLTDPTYNVFGIAIMMTLITTLVSPPLLNYELRKSAKGVRKLVNIPEKEILTYELGDKDLTELMAHKVILQFQSMGFLVNKLDPDVKQYTLNRHKTSLTLSHETNGITLETDKDNLIFVQRMVHEAAFYLKQSVTGILSMDSIFGPRDETITEKDSDFDLDRLIQSENIIPDFKFETKEGVVWELVEVLFNRGKIPQIKSLYYTVIAREAYMSGGLVNGLAIPHAHTDDVSEPLVAIGIKRDGVDFSSIDKKPTKIIFLILTPEKGTNTHIRLLACISRLGRQPKKIQDILELDDPVQIRRQILDAIYGYETFTSM